MYLRNVEARVDRFIVDTGQMWIKDIRRFDVRFSVPLRSRNWSVCLLGTLR